MKTGLVAFVIAVLLSLPTLAQELPKAASPENEEGSRYEENSPDFYLELISRMQQKRLFFASLAHLDVFEQRWPGDRRAWLMRADALRQTGDFVRARSGYRRLIELEPSAKAFHGLGLIAAAENQPAEAAGFLREASRLAPIDVRILNDLGYVQLLLGEMAEAKMSLNKAAELEPNNRQVLANLVLCHLLDGNVERAEGIMARHAFPGAQRESIRREAQDFRNKSALPVLEK